MPQTSLIDRLLKEKTDRKATDYVGGVRDWYKSTYKKDLPIATLGQGGNTHFGWEHSRAFDVDLDPSSGEGKALIKYLDQQGIPYIASHGASKNAQGQVTSTGKHIHVGPASSRLDTKNYTPGTREGLDTKNYDPSKPPAFDMASRSSSLVDRLLKEKTSKKTYQGSGAGGGWGAKKSVQVITSQATRDFKRYPAYDKTMPSTVKLLTDAMHTPEAELKAELRKKVVENDQGLELQAKMSPNAAERTITSRVDYQYQQIQEQAKFASDHEKEINSLADEYKKEIPQGGADQWIGEMFMHAQAHLGNLIAGVSRPVSTKAYNRARVVTAAIRKAAEDSGADRNELSKHIQGVGAGLVGPEMPALFLGLPAPAVFGVSGGLEAAGTGGGLPETVQGATTGYLTGKLYEAPVPFKKPLLRAASKGAVVGGGVYAMTGDAKSAITNAFMGAFPEIAPLLRRGRSGEATKVSRETSVTEPVTEVPEGHTRYYRADRVDAKAPLGGGWVNNVDYASQKYGAGQMGSESMWYVDVPNKALEAQYGDAQAAHLLRGNLRDLDATEPKLYRRVEAKAGPGAANIGDIPPESDLSQLTQVVSDLKGGTPKDRFKISDALADRVSAGRSKLGKIYTSVRTHADALWSAYRNPPRWDSFDDAAGAWIGTLQEITHDSRRFATEVRDRFRDVNERRGIYYWIASGGDEAVLQNALSTAPNNQVAQGLRSALSLSDEAKTLATNISSFFDTKLDRGIQAGLLKQGVEDYITRIYKDRPNKTADQILGDNRTGNLTTNFKYARKRVFDSVFQAMEEGYIPEDDIAKVIPMYNDAFEGALAGRAFVQSLRNVRASDGAPAFAVAGTGGRFAVEGGGEGIFVQAKTKANIKEKVGGETVAWPTSQYRVIDHPALRGHKYLTSTSGVEGVEGSKVPVIMQGDLLVHPEFYTRLKNTLSSESPLRSFTVAGIPVGKALQELQATVKTTAFGLSGFHQVTEDVHGLAHRVSPRNLVEINFKDPVQRSLIDHSLVVEETRGRYEFSDGAGGFYNWIRDQAQKSMQSKGFRETPTREAIERAASIGADYQDWLFKEHLPRLKMTMAMEALERNRARYKGTLSDDQILRLTAEESNAAFGGINYRFLARAPLTRDLMRVFLIAPDFFEARAKFLGRAVSPYGREQMIALGGLALTQFITGRVLSKAYSKDKSWHWNEPFGAVIGDRVYQLRTIPGDMWHLVTQPGSFLRTRMSPTIKAGSEIIFQRDEFGRPVGVGDAVLDYLKSGLPVMFSRQFDDAWWESILRSIGISNRPLTHELKARKGKTSPTTTPRFDMKIKKPRKEEGTFFKRG